ncbi:hypothetical protein LP420_12940 [Massilia sp. B-10]|nr:hypothetical protein LP420_12940 [Massilia sp. B-10]
MLGARPNGNKEIALNWITPHQKWGIHSTYSDNLRMLTLSRGGPHVWLSEEDAKTVSVVDNDWIEIFNVNGTLTARGGQPARPGGHDTDVSRPGKNHQRAGRGNVRQTGRHP